MTDRKSGRGNKFMASVRKRASGFCIIGYWGRQPRESKSKIPLYSSVIFKIVHCCVWYIFPTNSPVIYWHEDRDTMLGMKATAVLSSRAKIKKKKKKKKAEPNIVFSYICSNEFKILILFIQYYHTCKMLYSHQNLYNYLLIYDYIAFFHSTGVWKPRPRKGYGLANLWKKKKKKK